jgi:pimeloyl-ACP methyl ester carboxylesterase
MDRGLVTPGGIWTARGGRGERLLVLLHGMGANASVWEPLLPLIERSWGGRWLAPDLRGHGRSAQEGPYGLGMHAADVAACIEAEGPAVVTLVGHSFGGVVAALVATGWFGPGVREVAAVARYLRISGLAGLAAPTSATASAGVAGTERAFRVTMDPRAYGAVGPSIAGLLRLAAAPLRLAAGGRDPMVTLEHMRRIDPAAEVFEGVGHNAHWEAPERVWQFIAGGPR